MSFMFVVPIITCHFDQCLFDNMSLSRKTLQALKKENASLRAKVTKLEGKLEAKLEKNKERA